MVTKVTQTLADRAKDIYATRRKAELETRHENEFVAIEPESGD